MSSAVLFSRTVSELPPENNITGGSDLDTLSPPDLPASQVETAAPVRQGLELVLDAHGRPVTRFDTDGNNAVAVITPSGVEQWLLAETKQVQRLVAENAQARVQAKALQPAREPLPRAATPFGVDVIDTNGSAAIGAGGHGAGVFTQAAQHAQPSKPRPKKQGCGPIAVVFAMAVAYGCVLGADWALSDDKPQRPGVSHYDGPN